MLDVHCPRHRSRVLLTASAVDGVVNTGDAVVVHWRCYCGARGEKRFARGSHAHTPPSVRPL